MRIFVLSTLLFSALPFLGWNLYQHDLESKKKDPHYLIRQITQKKRVLPEYLIAEWLGLSIDKPTSLYAFSEEKAKQRLEEHLLIQEASVEIRLPDTLAIDLKLRQPRARIGDLSGAGVDSEGILFPMEGYISPKRLTTLYIGLDPIEVAWGSHLVGERYEKAIEVLEFFSQHSRSLGFFVTRIDTARAFEKSLGRSEVIVHCSEHSHHEVGGERQLLVHRWIVRLPTEGYTKRWGDLRVLCERLKEEHAKRAGTEAREEFDARIIDLRLPDLGFVK